MDAAAGTDWLEDLRRELPQAALAPPDAAWAYRVAGRAPTAVLRPRTPEEVAQALRFASDRGLAVCPRGGGTALDLGPEPPRLDLVLSLERLDRVLDHQPGDMTVTVEAGVTLAQLQQALRPSGQRLPLNPPFPERATLGGIAAADAWGSLRHAFGRIRDQLLGTTVVTPEGKVVRAGGKVVKNVAGYDLNKLYVGSEGTLGVLVEMTLKVWPTPQASLDLLATLPDDAALEPLLSAVMGSELLPTHLEAFDLEPEAAGGPVAFLVGFEGTPQEIGFQAGRLQALGEGLGARFGELTPEARRALAEWEVVGGATGLGEGLRRDWAEEVLACRLSGLSSEVSAHREAARKAAAGAGLAVCAFSYAGCGVTLTVARAAASGATGTCLGTFVTSLREQLSGTRTRVLVSEVPAALRGKVALWPPEEPPGLALARALKAELDPRGVLNPGRTLVG